MESIVPCRRSLFVAVLSSCNASDSVYGASLFALSKGSNIPSRNDLLVCEGPRSLIEEIVTGFVELLPIYSVSP